MKLLVAIKSKDNAENLYKSIRWVSRAGYDLKIFVPAKQWEDYNDAIKNAEVNYYLHLRDDALLVDTNYKLFAKVNNYELVVCIKDDKASFTGKRKHIELHEEVYKFAEAVGAARLKMSENPKLQSIKVARGITMWRST